MATPRAPKQWCLKPSETLTSFENWRQNLQYILALDPNFATFLSDCVTWKKKDKSTPHRGFTDDASTVPEGVRKTAAQKAALLELMLGQIANYAGVISRNTIIKKSTSLESIWETIRAHYHFQSTGARFLDFAQLKLKPGERAEDLYQRLMSFVEDSLLRKDGKLLHNDEALSDDEEMTPTLENLVVLIWLRLIHEDLPRLVQQRYRTELRSHTLATIKPEISQALDSLLDELHSNQEVRAMRAAAAQGRSNFRPQKAQATSSDDDDSDEDEPSKRKKKSPPSDDELKKIVKKILDDANLEEITMKTVCIQVYEKYPDFDLSHRKDFIKTTVKQYLIR